MQDQLNQLQSQVEQLRSQMGNNDFSSTITRASEMALRERLGIPEGTTFGTQESFAIGAIYISTVTTNPSALLGYGTWSAFATGEVLVGYKSGDANFGTLLGTGGEATHTLSTGEMPAHTHSVGVIKNDTGVAIAAAVASSTTYQSITSGSAGGGGAHNNIQPYITVMFWQRTA